MGRPQLIGALLLPMLIAGADVSPCAAAAEEEECSSLLQARGGQTADAETAPVSEAQASAADTFPDFSTGFDEPGPYLEEPNDDEANAPQPAHEGWETPTSLQQSSSNKTWGNAFCEAHETGFYCAGSTRVRCCSNHNGFVKCGTTARSSACGYSGGVDAGDDDSNYAATEQAWFFRRRRSWGSYRHHPRGYCKSHHTGNFCFTHHVVHCCFNHGFYTDCTTRTESSSYC